MGLFSISDWERHCVELAAGLPVDDRRTGCRAEARGPSSPHSPLAPARQPSRASREGWWARQDSNLQPDRYERPALTIELQAPPRDGRFGGGGQRCAVRLQGWRRGCNAGSGDQDTGAAGSWFPNYRNLARMYLCACFARRVKCLEGTRLFGGLIFGRL